MKGSKCALSMSVKILAAVGAINWGLVGVGMLAGGRNFNVVNMLLGFSSIVEAVVYLLVGVAGVMLLVGCRCKKCKCVGSSCESGDTSSMDSSASADTSSDSSGMNSMSMGSGSTPEDGQAADASVDAAAPEAPAAAGSEEPKSEM